MTTAPSYDQLWQQTWGDLQRFGPVHRHATEDLLATVASLDVTTILDVGCGSGDNLAVLANVGRYELAGVDVSERALAIARQRVPGADLRLLDVERDALREKFDVVISL